MTSIDGVQARTADAATLAVLLARTRARTLGLAEVWGRALPAWTVPYAAGLNPPLWELGHIGWFQEWWIGRNRERARGPACDPDHARPPSHLPRADDFYDSSAVAHTTRWTLPLPDFDATVRYLERVLSDALALLADAGESDDALYFWRLALFHEDMHNEASVYMAQALDIEIPEPLALGHGGQPSRAGEAEELEFGPCHWRLGERAPGFAFDNELGAHGIDLRAFRIDARPVSWARYLPFVEATGHPAPPHLRNTAGQWQQRCFGQWLALDLGDAAVHVSWDDAQAWCRWAGRRLPSEAEWECAALTAPTFEWGRVWDWTADPFGPYPGFAPHPYRDYSVPWFGSRRVLRGACAATAAQMVHPRYRNFFTPERRDIFAGFRSAA